MLDQVKDAASEIADVRRRIAAMGPNFDEQILGATRALYAPLIREPSGGVKVTADVAYGSDARQKLDVYQPAGAAEHVLASSTSISATTSQATAS
jgi:hypothetical protein